MPRSNMNGKLNNTQHLKKKIRDSAEWKQLRIDLTDKYDNLDPITQKRLLKGWNAHHMRMSLDTYADLDVDYFRPLNMQTHDVVHWCQRYAQKDPDFMQRLTDLVNEMVELNK